MKKKYILNTYSMFDDHLLTDRLERMALKGWQLQSMGYYLLCFEKYKPQALHYAAAFFPDAETEDPAMSENQLTYIDMCAQYGWELAANLGPMHIFCNPLPNPVPLETDDDLKLKQIDKSMGKPHILLHILLVLNCLFLLSSFSFKSNFRASTSISHILYPLTVGLTLFRSLAELVFYFRWFWSNSKRTAQNLPLLPTHSRIRRIGTFLILLFWTTTLICHAESLGGILTMASLYLLYFGVRSLSLRIGKQKLRSAFAVRLLIFLSLTLFLTLFSLKSNELRLVTFTPPRSDSNIIVQRYDPLPITLEELDKAVPHITYSYLATSEKSLLMKYQNYLQTPMGTDADLPGLRLSLRCARLSFLNKIHYESILKHYLSTDGVTEQTILHNAIQSFCHTDPESGSKTYALLYADRVLFLHDLFNMTDDNIALIIDRLLEV